MTNNNICLQSKISVTGTRAGLRRPLHCAGHFEALSELKMAKFDVKAEAKKDTF